MSTFYNDDGSISTNATRRPDYAAQLRTQHAATAASERVAIVKWLTETEFGCDSLDEASLEFAEMIQRTHHLQSPMKGE